MQDTAEPVDIQAGSSREHADTPKDRAKKAKAGRVKSSFPRPKSLRVTIEAFEKWLNSFTPEQIGRARQHFYREWPVINRKLIGEHKEKLIVLWEGGLPYEPDEDTPDFKTWVLKNQDWGGSGKYKVMCTEIGVPGCISMALFSLEDGQYPPRVDPATLVVGHPENKGHLEGLRASGVTIRGDDPEKYRAEQEKKQEMDIASVAFENLAKQNEKLQGRVDGLIERLEEADEEDDDPTAGVSQIVLETGLRMVEKQVDRVTQESAKSFNPIEMMNASMALAEKLKGDSTGLIVAIQAMAAQQTTFLTDMLAQQREETKYWRERANATPQASEAPKGVMEQLKDVAEFKSLARDLFGREPRAEREPEPPRKGLLETILENPQTPAMFNTLVGGLFQMLALARQPAAPLAAQSPEALKAALAGANAPPATAHNPAEAQALERKQAAENTLRFMERIEKTFVAHFYDMNKEELNGYTFAYCMLCEFVPNGQPTINGRQEYETIRDRWGAQFDQMIRSFPPIWNMVQSNVGKYNQFLKEFMEYDKFAQEQDAEPVPPAKVTAIKTN